MISAELPDAYLSSDTPTVDAFTLKAGAFQLTTLPVEIGELSETMSLSSKRRLHNSENGGELTLEADNTIPFGAEPQIRRKIRVADGLICVTMDIVMRNFHELTTLSAGGFKISGDIRRIGILPLPAHGSSMESPVMTDFSAYAEDGGVIYDAPYPPLGLLFESERERFDWMPGDDFWRWTNAGRIGNGKARFTVVREKNTVRMQWKLFERLPAKSPDEAPVHGRTWRITWAAAWKKLPLPETVKPVSFYDLTVCNWPRPTLASASLSKREDDPAERGCLCAAATLNILKKWVRTNLDSAQEGDVFALTNVLPVYCVNAGHVDRAKCKSLPHWDMMSIIEFRRWANRILSKRGASLQILAPPDSPLRGFMILG